MTSSHTDLLAVRNEERALFARRLYDLQLQIGGVFHTVGNEGDCEAAERELEAILEKVDDWRRVYEIPLSDEERVERLRAAEKRR